LSEQMAELGGFFFCCGGKFLATTVIFSVFHAYNI
jgi:hypothetical protein